MRKFLYFNLIHVLSLRVNREIRRSLHQRYAISQGNNNPLNDNEDDQLTNENGEVYGTWMRDSNKIEYVMGPLTKQFDSLDELGLAVSPNLSSRNISIIPFHLTSSTDLFCNRELNLEGIDCVGFDMDWTLAQYKEEFDLLAYNGAINILVESLDFPSELYSYRYKQTAYRRGCIIDKKRGNILKLDRHRYVRVAEHGLTPLSRSERKSLYKHSQELLHELAGDGFESVDTPFSLIDACLFAQLVDLKDRLGPNSAILSSRSYQQLWADCRRAVDRCHRNGVIKLTVAEDPEKYITYDPNIFPMLDSFRRAGRKTFLLTNSLWEYTQVVMSYLEGRKVGAKRDLAWMQYFDIIVVGGNKPAFLTDDRDALSMYHVRPSDGALSNIEYIPGQDDPRGLQALLGKGKVFQGGNSHKLHRLLRVTQGQRVLYVGDHIFSDILRTKRSVGWRTCLIVPELGREIIKDKRNRDEWKRLSSMREQQQQLEDALDAMQLQLFRLKRASTSAGKRRDDGNWEGRNSITTSSSIGWVRPDPELIQGQGQGRFQGQDHTHGEGQEEVTLRSLTPSDWPAQMSAVLARVDQQTLETQIAAVKQTVVAIRKQLLTRLDALNAEYHPRFGPLFRAGFQESRFALQITDYACVYTSRASNLGLVSPHRPLRPPRDLMPHDRFIAQEVDEWMPRMALTASEGVGSGVPGPGQDMRTTYDGVDM